MPARGRKETVIRQIQAAQPGAVLGCRCLTEAGDDGRSPKGAIPPLFTKAGTPTFLIMPALCPQALA